MKLTQLAKEPTLIKIELDDEEIRKEYNDSLEFYVLDRQPLDTFIKLATVKSEDLGSIITLIKDMILDEEGNAILTGKLTLPPWVILKTITKITDTLGK